jgi:hypothetical protein
MSGRRPSFPWSDQQIIEALGPHAIPDEDDERIVRDLAEFGALQILARREGGRRPRTSSARGENRRILISIIFEGQDGFAGLLPRHLRKTPTSPPTIRKVRAILVQCGWKESERTVLKDVIKIGVSKLREFASK